MLTSTLLTTIKNSLGDDGVYRTDAFLLERLNEGYKLVGLLSLFDERRSSVDITGTRNFFSLPKDGSDECIVPLHVSDANSGKRVHPSQLQQFEFYQTGWEGVVSGSDANQYVLLSPFNYAHAAIIVCPISDAGASQYNIIGAFVPETLTSTSTIRIPDGNVDVLVHYTRFSAFITEPGRSKDAGEAYREFSVSLGLLVRSLRGRFPSGRDYTPFPVEFVYDVTTEQQLKTAPPKTEEKTENA
uniref:Uncharacterized protein n=1 Tax=viral metagenome TaxID=1070528 RepID=A0A6M3KTX2_9ZZZZ